MRNSEYEVAIHEIIKAIQQMNQSTVENNKYLIEAFTEQKNINEKLSRRVKELEDYVAEQLLMGVKNEEHKG